MLTARRTELMLENVEKYLSMKRVKKVVLLWGIKTLTPPTQQLQELQDRANKSVIMKIVPEDKIRLRFHLYPEIDTSGNIVRIKLFNLNVKYLNIFFRIENFFNYFHLIILLWKMSRFNYHADP